MPEVTPFVNGKACVQPQTRLILKLTRDIPSHDAHQGARIPREDGDPGMLNAFCRKGVLYTCSGVSNISQVSSYKIL